MSNIKQVNGLKSIGHLFDKKNYLDTIAQLTTLLAEQKAINKKRGITNYLMGCTMFGGNTGPKHINPLKDYNESMIPRFYKTGYPGSTVDKFLNETYFHKLVLSLSDHTERLLYIQLVYYQLLDNDQNLKYIQLLQQQLDTIRFVKKHVPSELRLCGSIFTQGVVIGDTTSINKNGIHPHLDSNDELSCVITLGNVDQGGSTVFYSGLSENKRGKIKQIVPFKHGRIQIGNFSQVVHGVTKWKKHRVTLNFNIKKDIVNHFRLHTDKYYNQWKESGYQKQYFLAK